VILPLIAAAVLLGVCASASAAVSMTRGTRTANSNTMRAGKSLFIVAERRAPQPLRPLGGELKSGF
jgi:hypothetical protein